MITLADIQAAAKRLNGLVLRTPTIPSQAISAATGADVSLKLENLQVTGAFKERGAANRLALLTMGERARGVVAMSAGNHAQAVARDPALAASITGRWRKVTPCAGFSGTESKDDT